MELRVSGTELAGNACRLCDHGVVAADLVAHDHDERGDLVWHGWCYAGLRLAFQQGYRAGLADGRSVEAR